MSLTTQNTETFLPVYDDVPEKWEDARTFFVEQLKRISNTVNLREIGLFTEDEVISGKQFIPIPPTGGNPIIYPTIFRKVIDFGGFAVGANSQAHGINITSAFTLIHCFASGTDSVALTSAPIPNGDITIDATNINITSATAYDRGHAVIEFTLEI